VNQWRHCNGYLPTSGYIPPSKAAYATAPLKAIATVILSDIMRVLSNHYSMVNQWRHWKPLQRLF